MLIIPGREAHNYSHEMDQAYKLRHDVFVDEMGWQELDSDAKRERDGFDNEDAVHMLLYSDGKLAGYQRMLPTTKSYLLSEVYPELCETKIPRDASIWEWTRFAVAKEFRKSIRKLSPTGNRLLSGIVEWGMKENVHSIVIEMSPYWILPLVQLKFQIQSLGRTRLIGDEETIAIIANFDQVTLDRLREIRGDTKPILA
ncbi:MAG: acyl-homoserine-lactone synthase [Pseudomonadota bacterium]